MARALAEAQLEGDGPVAERYGVARATLRVWRHRLPTDPELARLTAAAVARLGRAWVSEAALTNAAALRALRAKIEGGELGAGELLGTVKTISEALTTHVSLMGDSDGAGDDREGHEAPPGQESDGRVPGGVH
jgi:transposase-like protein